MSLLTLESKNNSQNPSSTDPSIIRNNFKDGIELRKGTEVGLVSLSINKVASYEVIEGKNDTLTWRIGNSAQFNQHQIKIPAGEYTGIGLASQIKTALDNSTILGNYKGNWTIGFDDSKFDGDGAFTIDYGQSETPNFNEITLEQYAGNPNLEIVDNSTKAVEVRGGGFTNGIIERQSMSNIITGNKGIFPNDGEAIYEIKPVSGFPLQSFSQRFITDAIPLIENDDGTNRNFTLELPPGGSQAETNGWTYVAKFTDTSPDEYWYFKTDDEAEFGIGSDASQDATLEASWDYVDSLLYNESEEFLQDITAGGRYNTTPTGTGFKVSASPLNTKLNIPSAPIGYGRSAVGYVRNQLYNGRNKYPGNPDALITTLQPEGFDTMFNIKDNPTFDGIQIQLSQMLQNGAVPFPNPNWRNQSKYVFQNKTPSNWNTIPGVNPSPTNWSNFDYGLDHIQVKIQISNILNYKLFILHDKAGDGNWEEQTILMNSSQTGTNMTKNIIEDHFPLRPCFCMTNGGRYDRKHVKVGGHYDSDEFAPPTDFVFQEGDEVDDTTPGYVNTEELVAAPPSNAVKLSALFLFGTIFESDLVSNGGTVPDAEVPTPGSRIVNNIADLIGFNRFNIYPSGQVSNPTTSQHKPILTIREPNLLVELVDFNIKGYNGSTGDKGKIIASIPAEELNTNSRTGTLNYYSQYPIMIDLNLVNDTIAYDLNMIIRRPNGQVADDLVGTTTSTLLFKEGEETKQKRLMKEQVNLLASTISNINQIKTDSVGTGFPKL